MIGSDKLRNIFPRIKTGSTRIDFLDFDRLRSAGTPYREEKELAKRNQMDSLWIAISIGVLIAGTYMVIRMLSLLVAAVVDFVFAQLLQLFARIEKELFLVGHSSADRTSATHS